MADWSESMPEPQRSRVFMDRTELWPHPGLLPLKRPDDTRLLGIEEGFLFARRPTIVYLGNMFLFMMNGWEHKKIEYENLDALVADGWRVD